MPKPASTSPAPKSSLLRWLVAALVLAGLAWWLWPRPPEPEPEQAKRRANADETERLGLRRSENEADPATLRLAAKAAIAGTVRSRAGGPLADAQVCAWPLDGQLRGLARNMPTCVRTGSDGRYRIEGLWPLRTQVNAGAAEHRPQLWRTRSSAGTMLAFVSLAPGRTREAVDFELEGGGVEVSGVVRDLGGGEIEGALVKSDQWWSGGRSTRNIAFALSDAEGRFTMWVAPGDISLVGSAEGYAWASTETFAPTRRAEIFLTPESVLVGKVVDAVSGEPLPDVLVSIGRGVDDVRSDTEGNFRIGKLQPGVYKPIVRDDELFGTVDVQVHLGLAQTSEPIVIRAHRMAAVRGQVVVAGEGQPCPRGFVSLRQVADRSLRFTGTVEDGGQVTVRGVEPGTYEVDVTCVGFSSRDEYPDLELGGESVEGLVWEVDEGQAIRGRVVDASGVGVAQASVFARMVTDEGNARAQTSGGQDEATREDGSFEIRGLLPGRYEIDVSSDAPAPELPLEVELPAGVDLDDVRIELLVDGTLAGRVVDESGVPQPGVTVTAKAPGKWGGGNTMTDDAGNFVLEHLRVGELRVTAGDYWTEMRAPGTSDDDVQGELVTIEAGKRVELELVIESRSGVIRGRVLDEHGAPVDDAFISAERLSDSAAASASLSRAMVRWGSFGEQPILSEVDGSFTIDELSPGKYVVRAHRRGGGEALLEDVELGSTIELTIAPTSLLGGRLVVPGGEAPERFSITAEDTKQGISMRDQFYRTQGSWQIAELPRGSYRVTATSSAGTATTEVELAAGERREDVELELEPLVTVRGRLIDIDTREPVAGMIVNIGRGNVMMARTRGGDRTEVSDAEGRFEVEQAATGKVRIAITPRSFSTTSRYGWANLSRVLPSEPSVQDIGDIELVALRVSPEQAAGDIGFVTAQTELGTEPEQTRLRVGVIRPGGPASGTTLAPGDEIEKIDGKSVVGVDSSRFYVLTQVPPGTTIELTIAGGKTVSITAGPPLE